MSDGLGVEDIYLLFVCPPWPLTHLCRMHARWLHAAQGGWPGCQPRIRHRRSCRHLFHLEELAAQNLSPTLRRAGKALAPKISHVANHMGQVGRTARAGLPALRIPKDWGKHPFSIWTHINSFRNDFSRVSRRFLRVFKISILCHIGSGR